MSRRHRGSGLDIDGIKRRAWVVCVRNEDYEVSLERRKIYESLPDAAAEQHNQLRVIDESGDDHLFPARYFATIELPTTIRRALAVGYRFAVGRRTKRGVSRGTKAQRA